jgi:adenylate kinase family enzyme
VNRVAVIGSGGAGKSTFSRALAAQTGLPVIHLDVEFWGPGWTKMPDDAWKARVRELVAGERWITDGNYGGTMPLRLERADTIVFLDLPRLVCLASVTLRALRYREGTRPDMAAGNREKLDPEFLKWIWNYPRDNRPKIVGTLETLPPTVDVVHLRSRRAMREWLDGIPSGEAVAA